LQLPRDYTHALDIRNRVMLELEPDHITIRPDDNASSAGGAPDHHGPLPDG
ncbi:ABC transporter ATP-binding protein, partial [Actinacidiphila glaucinigra]